MQGAIPVMVETMAVEQKVGMPMVAEETEQEMKSGVAVVAEQMALVAAREVMVTEMKTDTAAVVAAWGAETQVEVVMVGEMLEVTTVVAMRQMMAAEI
mmetsp:Transcript_72267/g.120402  ORF Transcript_72267/g.120402 Transcript_72267/m.120402 type:complete len:98 (+) Transcript_72267:326-619(+)